MEIEGFDSCRPKPIQELVVQANDPSSSSFKTEASKETHSMFNRIQKLKSHLDSLRSPFRNRGKPNSYISDGK